MTDELESPDNGRTEHVQEPMIVRTFDAEMTAGDGRTVDVRIVPYGEQATSADGFGGVPKGVPYKEEWVHGAFSEQCKAAQVGRAKHVFVNFEHHPGFSNLIGHGLVLVERQDGFYGSFKMHETPEGDKGLMLVRERVLGGVSLEVPPRTVKSVRGAGGVIQRVKAHLHGIALCRTGAFERSVVLAVRQPEDILDEEIMPVDIDPETIERCRRLGIQLPQRYQAHPATTDTPAESGTSEAAPAEGENT